MGLPITGGGCGRSYSFPGEGACAELVDHCKNKAIEEDEEIEKGKSGGLELVYGRGNDHHFGAEFFTAETGSRLIQAQEDCVCWGITHTELEATYLAFPEFERVGRLITGFYYCLSEDRQLSQRMQDPLDKYRYILDTTPDLLERVQQKYMSSYLGVSLRTFQNMRDKYRQADRLDKR